jgi:NAD(P)-dependent dehydrogenase (short-subunit alcohol dehydrogenase family)
MAGRLDGKKALVTGGGRGIGAAIARRFAEEGAQVTLSYGGSKEAAEALAAEIGATAVQCDAATANATDALVRQTAKAMGGLDIVVNNAGVYPRTTIRKCSNEEFDRSMQINVRAPFEAFRAGYDVMNPGGAFITIGSVASLSAMVPGVGVYCATKAGVQLMARGAAREFGRKQIRSNIIQPGPIDTDMNPADGDTAAMQKMMVPLDRYGQAKEVADLALFLASDESSFINGEAVNIDGGLKA